MILVDLRFVCSYKKKLSESSRNRGLLSQTAWSWCGVQLGCVSHTSSSNLAILGPFPGTEPVYDEAGFELCISWNCISMEFIRLNCSTVS